METPALSHYRLLEKVGEGGMGVVYRAEDTRLGRTVALKVLTPQFSSDRLSVERFQREASSASALNHPHICTIHDVGEELGQWYLVMEFLEGRNLQKRMSEGPVSLRELLHVSLQAVEALAAAHQSGIVHRDIKPANIFVTESGNVKLLDFGLAKRAQQTSRFLDSTDATLLMNAESLTMPGFAIGTANYMSPEQACGIESDIRSDLFSFGIVLYEMATGAQPFRGESLPALLNAIVHLPAPPPKQLNPALPSELQRIIMKALEKEPDLRYQSAADLRSDLKRLQRQLSATLDVSSSSGSLPTVEHPSGRRLSAPWIAAAVAGVVCGAAGWLIARGTAKPAASQPYLFRQITDRPGLEHFPSLDATGEWLAYAARPGGSWDIYLKRVDGRNERNLTESDNIDETQPAYSPDGKSIAFRSTRDGGGIFVMGATGEAPERISTTGFNPAWSPDGRTIAFATEGVDSSEDRYLATSQLWLLDLNSRAKRMLFAGDAVQPAWSPNGRRIAFWRSTGGHRDIATIPAGGGTPTPVTADRYSDWNPVWAPDGQHLYFISDRSGSMNLWRVAIDQTTGAVKGEPEVVGLPAAHAGHVRFSRDGHRFVFAANTFHSALNRVQFDARAGTVIGGPVEIPLPFSRPTRPHLSLDGTWMAFNSSGLIEDIHVLRPNGSDVKHVTSDGRQNRGPRLSPDGSRVAFFSARGGNNEIWMANADGSGLRRVTFTKKNAVWPVWSPDGKRLAFTQFGQGSFVMDPHAEWSATVAKPLPAPGPKETFNAASWSPDGKWIAGFLQNKEDGTFPGIAVYSVERETFQRLSPFGMDPVWLSDGHRLLFNHEGRIYLADLAGGEPKEVLRIALREVSRRGFAVSPDDRWIYFALSGNESNVWLAETK